MEVSYVQRDEWLGHIPLLTFALLFGHFLVASIATHSGVVLARRSKALMFIFVFLVDGFARKRCMDYSKGERIK